MSDEFEEESKMEVLKGTSKKPTLRKQSSGNELVTFAASKAWRGTFPGPADRSFNYRKLLDESDKYNGIADASSKDLKVAIIGAGPAGLTAAHELSRCGVKKVHLFEASDRYGGRFWTKTLESDRGEAQFTAMDAGAMRMPPFIPLGTVAKKQGSPERQQQIWDGKSVLSYYLNKFEISTDEFPNPGSKWADTGIYYNEGSLPHDVGYDEKKQDAIIEIEETKSDTYESYEVRNKEVEGQMLIWPAGEKYPPNEELRAVKKKWDEFGDKFENFVKQKYESRNWQETWQNIVTHYYDKTFRDVVFLDPVENEDLNKEGYFGGLGMSEAEARIFYVIGAGDGGWGSFFNLSFLYVYRTFVHGFGTDLQVIEGLFDVNTKERVAGPQQDHSCSDSLGSQIASPKYLGTSTITDCLLFKPFVSGKEALYRYAHNIFRYPDDEKADETARRKGDESSFRMFFNSPISKIQYDNGKVRLHVKSGNDRNFNYDFSEVEYDAVIVTVPTHQFGTEIEVSGFDPVDQWPYDLQAYLSQAHWEPCCKVFLELRGAYWEDPDCNIPQIIESETAIRDTYGVKLAKGESERQDGILLLSYTWWRDATKLVGYDDQELINLAVKEADRMLANCRNMGPTDRISNYAKFTKDEFGNINYKGWVHHWELQKHYKGAARLYDQRTWKNTQVPMMYNQNYSKKSKLYFAGEGYHVDAGWVEPAFRTAIDSVLQLLNNEGIKCNFDFKFDRDFPKYDDSFDPMKKAKSIKASARQTQARNSNDLVEPDESEEYQD